MKKYPIEALLRPPVEFWSASMCLSTVVILLFSKNQLYLPGVVVLLVTIALLTLGTYRLLQGLRLLRYQYGLTRQPRWVLRFSSIPRREGNLFLGRGFKWTQKHMQRFRDSQSDDARQFVRRIALPQWIETTLRKATRLTRSTPSFLPLSGMPELHGVEPRESDVWMDVADRVGHMLVIGTTRVGKTRFAELLIAQDIERGDVVLVFDPKGDSDLLRRVYGEAKRCGREQDFRMFHLGYPQHSSRYNAIGRFSRVTEVATRIANQLPSEGNSAAFKEFAWRFVNIIAGALVELRRVPDYRQIRKYINDIEPLFIEYTRNYLMRTRTKGWAKEVREIEESLKKGRANAALRGRDLEGVALMTYVQANAIDDPVLEGLLSAYKYDRTYFDKIVSSVGPLMEKLTTGSIADLISPRTDSDDPRPLFDWLEVIREGGIVYVGLDALSDSMVASAVGNSMFADLVSVAGHIYKHGINDELGSSEQQPHVSIHADEFNELIGDEFIPLLNKAGGAGFQVTAYTQTWSDVEARVGSRAKSGQVAGNFNTVLMLRVKEYETAEMLTRQLPKVEVYSLSSASSATDATAREPGVNFQSRNEDRLSVNEVPLLTPAELVSLPRGHAFALLDGGTLWKLRLPLPDKADPMMPDSLREVTAAMDSSYQDGFVDRDEETQAEPETEPVGCDSHEEVDTQKRAQVG